MSWAALLVHLALGAADTALPLQELERLDRELARIEASLRGLQSERHEHAEQLALIEADLAATKVRAAEALQAFSRRVRALARMPAGSRAVLLGRSQSLREYLHTMQVLRWLARHDRRLHKRHTQESQRLRTLKTKALDHRQALEKANGRLRSERDTVARTRRERLELLARLKRDGRLAGLGATERRQANKQLAGLVGALPARGTAATHFAQNRGRLPWPARGPLRRTFGQQVELAYGTTTTSNGIDILARAGCPVQAIAPGRVVFADWMRGYGQIVIVDHGDEYHSLMAHLATVEVKVGRDLTTGAIIGTVGDTGSTEGTALHFQVRHKGLPRDPLQFLAR